jgi:uncharacterized glyoxalase superfamily protein PhnB
MNTADARSRKNNSHDPLTVLHGDELPVQPDPAFAARLRARLESAVNFFEAQPNRTGGGREWHRHRHRRTERAHRRTCGGRATAARGAALSSVADARDAIAWYVDTFGASLVGEMYEMEDGRIGHAELQIGDGVLYLADEYPELGLKAPSPQASSVSLMLHVADTDSTLERARERGAEVQREPYENYGSRNATIVDPFGHRWMLSVGHRRRGSHPARRRGLRSVVGADAERRRVLWTRAGLDLRPGHP